MEWVSEQSWEWMKYRRSRCRGWKEGVSGISEGDGMDGVIEV
jgi:hypothetical protein